MVKYYLNRKHTECIFALLVYLQEDFRRGVDEEDITAVVRRNLEEHGHEAEFQMPENIRKRVPEIVNKLGFRLFQTAKQEADGKGQLRTGEVPEGGQRKTVIMIKRRPVRNEALV